ncbi:hypothetical protein L873DRAFT_1841542 [Choiromyces venosus 120613-1]|uniref:Uncharacterized protein n=1 Tax=Choiromyces venosus 120613-1 TaxID=1336337 RepID=A0A3N4JX20_9PEZI|nr:hypothetical protein L873DRAFT_1841542 [Choiromyces venosus 120613-1]
MTSINRKKSARQQEIDYEEHSLFALFWNMARRLIHSDISKDIEEFLETVFFASNYSRAIHKEGTPHKYSLFWTTERSLGEGEGGNFFISDYGIRIQGAKNTMRYMGEKLDENDLEKELEVGEEEWE